MTAGLDTVAATPAEVLTRVPLIEETVRVSVRERETGRVRVTVGTEVTEQLVRETLRTERVEAVHVPVNRELAPGEAVPQPREEGDLLIVPVLEEVLVIEKRLVLREEIHLRRTATQEVAEQSVPLRRQHAEVERLPADPAPRPETP